ncbi:MAG TPA: hypothetical protein VNF47_03665 [Streptosporangiaceae bacterium]|nr:hypothetical protein [Streptosporangiaceae bacterium]
MSPGQQPAGGGQVQGGLLVPGRRAGGQVIDVQAVQPLGKPVQQGFAHGGRRCLPQPLFAAIEDGQRVVLMVGMLGQGVQQGTGRAGVPVGEHVDGR